MDQTTKNKKIGLLIMVLAAIAFVSLFAYFNQAGTKIEYRNPTYMLKMICTDGILLLGLYFGLYFVSGKKLANQIGGGLTLLMIAAYIIGFLTH